MNKTICLLIFLFIFVSKINAKEIRRISHTEPNGFKWIEVVTSEFNGSVLGSYALDSNGNLLIAPSPYGDCNDSYVVFTINKHMPGGGWFLRKTFHPDVNGVNHTNRDDFFNLAEVFSTEGNVIIPASRFYPAIYSGNEVKDYQYFVIQNKNGIGICDLNGYEIVKPEYSEYSYDGYDFFGILKSTGRRVTKKIHDRPTVKQSSIIQNSGFYYQNMPWLVMPGPSYTPNWKINWNTNIDWSSIPVYGGVGDYVSTEFPSMGTETTNIPNVSNGHKCAYCNGLGKKVVSQSVATLGTADQKVRCNECGQYYYRSTGHSHVFCGHCGGTGIAK